MEHPVAEGSADRRRGLVAAAAAEGDEHLVREAEKIAVALGRMFPGLCEVVLHDLRDPQHAIRVIENNLSGREVGDSATELGLVARVVPADELQAAALDLARRLASGATRGIGMTKRLLNLAEDAALDETLAAEAALQELAGRTEDHAEGVAAFTEKRPPAFHGR